MAKPVQDVAGLVKMLYEKEVSLVSTRAEPAVMYLPKDTARYWYHNGLRVF